MTAIEFNYQVASLRGTLELFTRRFTSDQIESEDLVQDTVLKALTYKDKFRQNTNLKGWLFTIMRNTFINKYRKARRIKTATDDTPELFYLNVADEYTFHTPDGSFEYKDILKSINEIKEDLLTPFKMHTEGFKYYEIAEELQIPIGTVKNRIFHARKEIQKKLLAYDR